MFKVTYSILGVNEGVVHSNDLDVFMIDTITG